MRGHPLERAAGRQFTSTIPVATSTSRTRFSTLAISADRQCAATGVRSLDEALGFQVAGGDLFGVLAFDGDFGVEALQRRAVKRLENGLQQILDFGVAG